MIPVTLLTSDITAASGGCTPCECGIPGACLREMLPEFLRFLPTELIAYTYPYIVPFVLVLVPALLSRGALLYLFHNANTSMIRTFSVFLGTLFILPILFTDSLSFVYYDSIAAPLVSLISVVLAYIAFMMLDMRKKKASLVGSFAGAVILAGFIYLLVFLFRTASQLQYSLVR